MLCSGFLNKCLQLAKHLVSCGTFEIAQQTTRLKGDFPCGQTRRRREVALVVRLHHYCLQLRQLQLKCSSKQGRELVCVLQLDAATIDKLKQEFEAVGGNQIFEIEQHPTLLWEWCCTTKERSKMGTRS